MKLNGKYRMLHSCLGLICSSAFGYNAFFLAEYGFDASETGMIIALFNVLTALSLPVFGRIADRSRRFHWKNMLLIFAGAGVLIWGALLFCSQKLLVGILFQTGGLLISCMYPMTNIICFFYAKRGLNIDYGIARGLNSLFYAVGAYVLGQLTVRMGGSVIIWMGLLICAVILWPVLRMPYLKTPEREEERKRAAEKVQTEKISGKRKKEEKFWKKYPSFSVLVLGSVLLMTVFSLTGTFLIRLIEEVGGDSSNLGIALAICAAAEVPVLMLFSQIVKRISETKLMIFSGIMFSVKSLILLLAGNVGMIYVAQLLQPFAYALFASASVFFSDRCMEEEDEVTGQSLLSMSGSAGSVIGSLVGGWLVENSGVRMSMLAGLLTAMLTTAVIGIAVKMYHKECRLKQSLEQI